MAKSLGKSRYEKCCGGPQTEATGIQVTSAEFDQRTSPVSSSDEAALLSDIHHAAHLLPAQGPITVFVHHNTLHAFEHLPFEAGVKAGGEQFGCHAYLPEERYREKLRLGRIRVDDLCAVLIDDLGEEVDRLVASFGTRYALRLAMLQYPLHVASAAELQWVMAETDALKRFRQEVDTQTREAMIAATRKWVICNQFATDDNSDDPNTPHRNEDDRPRENQSVSKVLESFNQATVETWSDETWESFALRFLWQVCREGVDTARDQDETDRQTDRSKTAQRHRDVLLRATGEDTDLAVDEVLIRLCSCFLDQGFTEWDLPDRERGLFQSFLSLYGNSKASPTRWHRHIHREVCRIKNAGIGPLASIENSLRDLGVDAQQRSSFINETLLALRGWAGMVWQMESNAQWAPHPAPDGSLIEFLAVRLVLDRVAIRLAAREHFGFRGPLHEVRDVAKRQTPAIETDDSEQLTFTIFQIAQVRGWKPEELHALTREQWTTLIHEIETFGPLERRRTYHLAFERKYRNETLDAVMAHCLRVKGDAATGSPVDPPAYQIACCIDEREESFRRHLEEIDPDCETFGVAGFFGVAMYYRGVGDAHFTPLCPVSVKPAHYVVEEPLYSVVQADRRRAEARKRIGAVTRQAHRGTRTMWGGILTGVLGSLAAFPLVARVLFPRSTAQIKRGFGDIIRTSNTELRLERTAELPGSEAGQIGYSVDEMVDIVEGGLRALGLAKPERLSKLVIVCGHGSASLNNPHEAAHDCGACGGGRGGPNARAFAVMANDPRVRRALAKRQLTIPESTYFIGGYHNTCADSMAWYDLDRLPLTLRPLFEKARDEIDEARRRSAHERCRRFESADLALSTEDALRHVEGRAEDLSQTRPEYGHATNAICFVGHRNYNRGLFLDRRAFLTSYDPSQDDSRSSILEDMLRAVIPVCAGINLEYYFSYTDPTGYGSGTKLPHNITSLIGVMDGAASDLRPGLPWQMVDIHESVRLLFVIETSAEAMQRIIDENEAIRRLVHGQWVQLAIFDPESNHIRRFVDGQFVPYEPESSDIPTVSSSAQWYGGKREHLGFASIVSPLERKYQVVSTPQAESKPPVQSNEVHA